MKLKPRGVNKRLLAMLMAIALIFFNVEIATANGTTKFDISVEVADIDESLDFVKDVEVAVDHDTGETGATSSYQPEASNDGTSEYNEEDPADVEPVEDPDPGTDQEPDTDLELSTELDLGTDLDPITGLDLGIATEPSIDLDSDTDLNLNNDPTLDTDTAQGLGTKQETGSDTNSRIDTDDVEITGSSDSGINDSNETEKSDNTALIASAIAGVSVITVVGGLLMFSKSVALIEVLKKIFLIKR